MKMTIDEQRIELMTVLGWTGIWKNKLGQLIGIPPDKKMTHVELPPLTLDLMHSAEAKLTKDQCYAYQSYLCAIAGDWEPKNGPSNWLWHTTAQQRCEAILRTVGRWRE